MRFFRLSAAVAVWTIVSLIGGMPSEVRAQSALTKVAVANPVRVFNQIQKTIDLRKQMEAQTAALDNQRIAKQNEIRDLQARRELLNKNAPDYQALQKEIMEKTVGFQTWVQITKMELERSQKLQIQSLFEDITSAIAKVAEAKGIEIVMAEQKPEIPPDLDQVTVEQLRVLLGQRNILYSKSVADITEAVILQMDADYKSSGR